ARAVRPRRVAKARGRTRARSPGRAGHAAGRQHGAAADGHEAILAHAGAGRGAGRGPGLKGENGVPPRAPSGPRPPARMLVISPIVHYRHDGRLHGYAPYAREIDVWADLVGALTIAAPCRDQRPPPDCLAFTRLNIRIRRVLETGGDRWEQKALQLLALPILTGQLVRAMRDADVIQVRCPGNLGLLGAVLAPLFSGRLVAKFAGEWSGYPAEPW